MSDHAPLAPIALFVYNRVDHAQRVVESLKANPECKFSHLFVFSDGARSGDDLSSVTTVRGFVRAISGFASVTVIERETNWGLAKSIVSGVTELCESHGRVIVMEDDLVVSRGFLSYMNQGLDRYRDDDRVMQVAGYMFETALECPEDALFLSFISSWGWATWSRAWQHFNSRAVGFETLKKDAALRKRFDLDGHYAYFRMLRAQQAGTVQSWAILWYLSVFNRGGLALYPKRSLVYNTGFDGSGINCRVSDIEQAILTEDFQVLMWPDVRLSAEQQKVFAALPSPRYNVSSLISRAARAVFAR